jgi:hypothetical protein
LTVTPLKESGATKRGFVDSTLVFGTLDAASAFPAARPPWSNDPHVARLQRTSAVGSALLTRVLFHWACGEREGMRILAAELRGAVGGLS